MLMSVTKENITKNTKNAPSSIGNSWYNSASDSFLTLRAL